MCGKDLEASFFGSTSMEDLMRRKLLSVFVVAAALLMFSAVASADTATFDLTLSNGSISPPAASYGTVTLTLDGSNIDVVVTAAPGYQVGHVFGFNVADGDTAGLAISNETTGWSLVVSPTSAVDGFGKFDAEVKADASLRFDSLTFTVSRTAGFTSVNDLVDGSTLGPNLYFAVHIFPVDGGSTGYAAAVPEPATLTLFGTGLLGVGVMLRRRRRQS